MPTLTRWFIKSALVYFVVALLLATALAAQPLVALPAALGALAPVYFHFFMVGWVAQMIFGIAYWMFPRHSRERPRGSEILALVTYVTLNVGLLARAMAEPMLALGGGDGWRGALIASAALQWVAGLAFAVNTWARVKER